ncbi:MAG TPA: PEGA domain-containing protein, partial [Minicystis sp.]|nr:PEGA domain-containing protein [Minicystis sp.]
MAAPPDAGRAADARRLDAAATALAKAGAIREALAALRKSEELAPSAGTLKRIAGLERDQHDFAAAYATWQELMTRFGDGLGPRDKAEAERALAELAAITGAVHVRVAEPGAEVQIDGVALGQGPLDATRRVNLGAHAVHVEKSGFSPFDARIDAAADKPVDVVVELRLVPASVDVIARGGPGHVRIDGADVGPAPFHGELPPGKHTVEVGEEGAVSRRELTLAPGEHQDVVLEGDTRGALVVRASPAGARITVDGAARGTDTVKVRLPEGAHVVEVTLAGYEAQRATVSVAAGGEKDVALELTALPKPPRFDGVYADVAAAFAASPSPSEFVTDACAERQNVCSGSSAAYGATLLARVGYSFGFLGVEGVSTLRYDQVSKSIRVGGGTETDFLVYRVTVMNGVGVRLMPKTQGARFATGLALAWS